MLRHCEFDDDNFFGIVGGQVGRMIYLSCEVFQSDRFRGSKQSNSLRENIGTN
jgi:hypothetical protein